MRAHLLPLEVEVLHEHAHHGRDFVPRQIIHLQTNGLNEFRYLIRARIQVHGT